MEGKSAEWIEQQETRIREAFELFDKEKADAIQQEEVYISWHAVYFITIIIHLVHFR